MKRVLDVALSCLGLLLCLPLFVIISLLIRRQDKGSVFYVSERMKTLDEPFQLIKFRTMSQVADGENAGVTGGDKSDRITPIGRKLRHYRFDEIPQLINVLKGDMSLVGPRPPLRQYTKAYPDVYRAVLRSKPGITGLATLGFHRHEERLIAAATTPQETEQIYTSRCIPRKATLDLIYQKHQTVCYDIVILWRTIRKVLGR